MKEYFAATKTVEEKKTSASTSFSSFDINKSLKALTKYDTVEVNDDEEDNGNEARREVVMPTVPSGDGDKLLARDVDNNNICGIKFTRPDYFMVPPLEDLHTFINKEGRCIVTGLVIGRIGYGNVYFATPIDLTNMNIDELVHFRYRELTIYPDDKVKPPLGQGLNRPAQVTLDCVWPKDRKNHTVVNDIEYLISMNFSETLRDLCLKHGTKFIDYRPETGSWVFGVEHFSKYAFTESDDEEAAERLDQFMTKQQVKKVDDKKLQEKQIEVVSILNK